MSHCGAAISRLHFGLCLSLILFARFSLAQSLAPTSPSSVVEISVAGPSERTGTLEPLVRDLLRSDPIVIHWSVVPRIESRDVLAVRSIQQPIVARVWLELSDPLQTQLFVSDAGGERFVVRTIPAHARFDEIEREQLGQIIGANIEALLLGEQIGISRALAEAQIVHAIASDNRPSSSPSQLGVLSPETPSRWSYGMGAFYDVAMIADGPEIASGPGISAEIATPSRSRVGAVLALSGQYRLPLSWRAVPAGASFEVVALRLLPALSLVLTERLLFQIGAGLGIDITTLTPQLAPGSSGTLAGGGTFLLPIAFSEISVHVRLVGPAWFLVALHADVDLSGTHYDLRDDRGTTVLLAPWSIYPGISCGIVIRSRR